MTAHRERGRGAAAGGVIEFETLSDLCRWLRVERLERGLSMRDAAHLTGVSVSTICRVEQADKGMVAESVWKVAAGYGFRIGFTPKDGTE